MVTRLMMNFVKTYGQKLINIKKYLRCIFIKPFCGIFIRKKFSMLLVDPILCVNLRKSFLDEDTILKTKGCLFRFINEERYIRSYEEDERIVTAICNTIINKKLVSTDYIYN